MNTPKCYQLEIPRDFYVSVSQLSGGMRVCMVLYPDQAKEMASRVRKMLEELDAK